MKLYLYPYDELNIDYSKFLAELPKARIEAIRHMQSGLKRAESAIAGFLLRKATVELGIPKEDENVAYGAHGKPYFVNHPEIKFNISHTKGLVALAIGENEVGVDVEYTREVKLGMVKRFFTEEEYTKLNKLSEEQKKAADSYFTRLWTLKESYVKCVGDGTTIPFNSFSFEFDKEGNASIVFEGEENSKDYSFFEYNYQSGYRVAVCVKGNAETIEVEYVE